MQAMLVVVGRVETAAALFALARAGLGAGLFSIEYARRYPELVQLSPELDGFETTTWVLTHRDLARVARVKTFIEFVQENWTQSRAREE